MATAMPSRRLYIHCTIITVNPSRDIITDGAILVEDTRIVAIGTSQALLAEVSDSRFETVDLGRKIVIPGLINTHACTWLSGSNSCIG